VHTTPQHRALWTGLVFLAGAVLAVIVYSVTADVVWTLIPLLLTVAGMRRMLSHNASKR
jgi:hypothetical protein